MKKLRLALCVPGALQEMRHVHGGLRKGGLTNNNLFAEQRKKTKGLPVFRPERKESVQGSSDGQLHRQRLVRFGLPTEAPVPRYSWTFVADQLRNAAADALKVSESAWKGGRVGIPPTTDTPANNSLVCRAVKYELARVQPILLETAGDANLAEVVPVCELMVLALRLEDHTTVASEDAARRHLLDDKMNELIKVTLSRLETLLSEESALIEGTAKLPLRQRREADKRERQLLRLQAFLTLPQVQEMVALTPSNSTLISLTKGSPNAQLSV